MAPRRAALATWLRIAAVSFLGYKILRIPLGTMVNLSSPALSILWWILNTCLLLGMIVYLRRLIRRLPHRSLERHATILLWAFAALCAYSVLSSALLDIIGEPKLIELVTGGQLPGLAWQVLQAGEYLSWLICQVWLAVVVLHMRRAVPEEAG